MEEKTILQRIFEVANDATSDGTTELIITQDNMKEIVQEINEKYVNKDKIEKRINELNEEIMTDAVEYDYDDNDVDELQYRKEELEDLLEEE